MDSHQCVMTLESFRFPSSQLRIILGSKEDINVEDTNLESFSYMGHTAEDCTYEGVYQFSCVRIIFNFQRNVGFFVLQVSPKNRVQLPSLCSTY